VAARRIGHFGEILKKGYEDIDLKSVHVRNITSGMDCSIARFLWYVHKNSVHKHHAERAKFERPHR
jgi:hypothetical protein